MWLKLGANPHDFLTVARRLIHAFGEKRVIIYKTQKTCSIIASYAKVEPVQTASNILEGSVRMSLQIKTILVVDDNQDVRDLISLVLEKEGYRILLAVDGDEGLNKIAAYRPDLVLLDVMMPGLSGFQVLDMVRKNKDKGINSIPICMITAKSLVEDIDLALEMGASSYIVKPFRPTMLAEKIRELLDPSTQ